MAGDYPLLGVDHILSGYDHLAFVLALILIVSGWRRLLLTVAFFTLAHSITLAAATLELLWVPGPHCPLIPMLCLKPERHHTNSRRHEANHSFPRLDDCFPTIELSRIVAAGRLLHGVDVSARLNALWLACLDFRAYSVSPCEIIGVNSWLLDLVIWKYSFYASYTFWISAKGKICRKTKANCFTVTRFVKRYLYIAVENYGSLCYFLLQIEVLTSHFKRGILS